MKVLHRNVGILNRTQAGDELISLHSQLEWWNTGKMGTIHSITLKNTTIHGINNAMDRKNINRGFKKLRVWPPARRSYAPEGKTPLPFMCLRVKYLPTFRSNLKKLLPIVPPRRDCAQYLAKHFRRPLPSQSERIPESFKYRPWLLWRISLLLFQLQGGPANIRGWLRTLGPTAL